LNFVLEQSEPGTFLFGYVFSSPVDPDKLQLEVEIDGIDSNMITFSAMVIVGINEPPSDFTFPVSTIEENSDTVIGSFQAQDEDSTAFTYQLLQGVQYFQLIGVVLVAQVPFNYELLDMNPLAFTVQCEDDYGNFLIKEFNLTVTDINEAPTALFLNLVITVGPITSFLELGTLSTQDPDFGDSHIYTFVDTSGGEDNSKFGISDTILYASEDLETNRAYNIAILSRDTGGLTLSKTFLVFFVGAGGGGVVATTNEILFTTGEPQSTASSTGSSTGSSTTSVPSSSTTGEQQNTATTGSTNGDSFSF
jgi:hypothetical protein